ncbi:FAD-dependent oxidoreductase [Blastococcus brunescens]|uniref:ferredoxin--NADP(+) reductase n=1 Tax=Blastococcus brunescens TaxID=1564165 RepID=A0ABZ1B3C4_9ACTN|nr:FAD-dependent oxidoreductase [Blastococcus sp. BMG 8361]WRL64656.1 FAD-dependent oxidoreductase [Blastococcus sp. BMG 8361]
MRRARRGQDASRVRRRFRASPVGPSPSPRHPLRIAVVGAGPAGIYAADALTRQDAVPVAVDLIDRLPTPFGLVRHGIAPDHPKMRAIRDTLHRSLEDPLVRFVGNVDVGTDITLAELRRHVDAVVYTYGASLDRQLGIEGEQLPGSLAATDLVAWYTGHPDADRARVEAALAGVRSVVVVGVGNVALDVARVLSRTAEELEPTDMPQHVLDVLAAAPVEEVTVLGRRGPAQATFTTQELRELDGLADATVLVDPADLELDPGSEERAATDRNVSRNLAVLRGWADHTATTGRVRLRLRFFRRPVRLLGEDRVTGVEVERTAVDGDGRAMGTGELEALPADLVVRSVGYRGLRCPGCRWTSGRAPCRTSPAGCCATGRWPRASTSRGGSSVGRAASSGTTSTTPGRPSPPSWPTRPTACCAPPAPLTTWWTRWSPGARSRCCSTTGGRSTPPRPRSAPAAGGPGRRCTSGRH